jgi:hypothetical protein
MGNEEGRERESGRRPHIVSNWQRFASKSQHNDAINDTDLYCK